LFKADYISGKIIEPIFMTL